MYSEVQLAKAVPTFKKIRHYDLRSPADANTVSTALSDLMVRVAVFSGLKSEISIADKKDIAEMITTVFSGLSFEELDYAFKMHRYGQLGEKVQHYELFNAEYVSEILVRYQKWLRSTRITLGLPMGVQKKQEGPTEEEKQNLINNGILKCYETYLISGMIESGYTWVYHHFYDLGHLPNHSKKYRDKIKRKAQKQHYKKLKSNTDPLRSISGQIKQMRYGQNPIRVLCAAIILKTFFSKITAQNIDIRELMNTKK